MKTINTVLPVYNKIEKQCYRRARDIADEKHPVLCPRWRLPSMQWNVEADDPGCLCSIRLIDLEENESEILPHNFFSGERQFNFDHGNVTNAGYDTFADASPFGFTAIKTTAADVDYVFTDPFAVTKGDSFLVRTELTLNSGTAPQIFIVDNAGSEISNIVRLETGIPYPATDFYFYVLTVTDTDAAARLRFRNNATELSNYYVEFAISDTCAPSIYSDLTDEYFQYKGGITAGYAGILSYLPSGIYYLKFTTVNGYVYYSDIFKVDCIYPNLITGWANSVTVPYETFTSSGVEITSAIETGIAGRCRSSNYISVIKGENIRVIFFLTLNSGVLPTVSLYEAASGITSDSETAVVGLNDITLTSTRTRTTYRILFSNTAASNFSTSDVLVMREYSEKYLRIDFSNTCDIADLLYQDGIVHTVWFESEPMECIFPQEEEGQKNGEGKFIRTFVRQDKKYVAKTLNMPDYMVEVFNRMKLHDTVEITDLVGDVNDINNLEVEHEWLAPGKYYARITLTFDYD